MLLHGRLWLLGSTAAVPTLSAAGGQIRDQASSWGQHMALQSRWVLTETELFSGLCQRAACKLQWLGRDELHLV